MQAAWIPGKHGTMATPAPQPWNQTALIKYDLQHDRLLSHDHQKTDNRCEVLNITTTNAICLRLKILHGWFWSCVQSDVTELNWHGLVFDKLTNGQANSDYRMHQPKIWQDSYKILKNSETQLRHTFNNHAAYTGWGWSIYLVNVIKNDSDRLADGWLERAYRNKQ